MIKLGDKVRDKISGFEGIAIAKTLRLYNSESIEVQPEGLKDGKVVESHLFAIFRLELVQEEVQSIGFDLENYLRGKDNFTNENE